MASHREVLADLIAQLLTTDPELRLIVLKKLQGELDRPILEIPENKEAHYAQWYENKLGLSARTSYALHRAGVSPMKLMSMGEKELLDVRFIGKVSVAEIRLQMIRHNLQSPLNPPPEPT